MKELDELTEVQRKIEAIIHGTTEEMREKQPGVMAWRNEVYDRITAYRKELVNRIKEVAL